VTFKLGLLRLTDSAPLVIAKELDFFEDEKIEVSLSVEPSWANMADKLGYGLLDGGVMLPPLALAVGMGLRGALERLIVPSSVSLNGNTVTLAPGWADDLPTEPAGITSIDTARRFGTLLRRRAKRPTLAVVHTLSTHNLLLRYWLAAGGIDPDREVDFVVVPPAETVTAMREGKIDGFCAGAPWGEVAARLGLGRTVATSHGIWNHCPEKVFTIRRDIAERYSDELQAMLRALLRAALFCDAPENAEHCASILSREKYLGLPADIILTSLPGAASRRPPASHADSDVSVFFANAATFPWRSHALWFLHQMRRWGYLDDTADASAATGIYRPDLYAEAANALGLPVPSSDMKTEGERDHPWLLPAVPSPIAMGPDRFCDGARFDPE
jgi:NitT/TauT family transport system ATP-binding protein/nitrate/nitrite transport system substrate-binding protein